MLKVCPVHHQFPYMGASIPNSFLEFAKLREHSSKSMQLFMSLLPTLQICTTHFNRWSKQKDLIGYVSLMWCRFTFESLNLQYCFSPFRIFFFFYLDLRSIFSIHPPPLIILRMTLQHVPKSIILYPHIYSKQTSTNLIKPYIFTFSLMSHLTNLKSYNSSFVLGSFRSTSVWGKKTKR